MEHIYKFVHTLGEEPSTRAHVICIMHDGLTCKDMYSGEPTGV